MPIYEYVCDQGHRFEVIHGIHDAGPGECPVCHSANVRKAFAAPAIHFKGSGWAKKDRSATSRPGTNAADGKADGTSADDQPAEKPAASGDGTGAGAATTPPPAKGNDSTKPSTAKPAAASKADGD